jgi:excisionase family DNA binding protein
MKLYTIKEFSEMIRLSKPTIRQLIYQNKIAYLRIGRRILIPESTLQDILSRSLVPAKPRINRTEV